MDIFTTKVVSTEKKNECYILVRCILEVWWWQYSFRLRASGLS